MEGGQPRPGLEVQVYHGAEGRFLMVEDDCSGRRSSPVAKTRFTYTLPGEKEAVFRMELEGEADGIVPANRTYQVTLFGVREPEDVLVNGAAEVQQTYREEENAPYRDGSTPSSARAARVFAVSLPRFTAS